MFTGAKNYAPSKRSFVIYKTPFIWFLVPLANPGVKLTNL